MHRIEARTEPLSENIVASQGDVTACLELAGGAAERLGLKPGDRVEHRFFAGEEIADRPVPAQAAAVDGSPYPNDRSTPLTTGLPLRPTMICVRWSRSHTSSSISISVKSCARRSMRTLSMLPSASPITCAIWASEPGSLSAVTTILAGNRSGIVGVDVPGHVDPALVLVLLELGRMDLEDADATRRRRARRRCGRPAPRRPPRTCTGTIVLEAANGQHLRLLGFGAAAAARPAELEADHLGEVEPALLGLAALAAAALARSGGRLGQLGFRHNGANHVLDRQLAAADAGVHLLDGFLRQSPQISS